MTHGAMRVLALCWLRFLNCTPASSFPKIVLVLKCVVVFMFLCVQQLEAVIAKVEELKRKHEESVSEKNALREEAEMLELKLDRANKLVSGLSGYVSPAPRVCAQAVSVAAGCVQ